MKTRVTFGILALLPWLACCSGGPEETPQAVLAIRQELRADLGRTTCEGCPVDWAQVTCEFTAEFSRLGGGSEAARCAQLVPYERDVELPEGLEAIAVGRIGEAVRTAVEDPHGWLTIYMMGYDLFRSGHPTTISVGQDAQALALRHLNEISPDLEWNWPADLARFLAAAVDLRHSAYLACIDGTFDPRLDRSNRTTGLLDLIGRVRNSDKRDAGALKAFLPLLTDYGSGQLPVATIFDTAVALEAQSWALATRGAAQRYQAERGDCPADLAALVPDWLPQVPADLSAELPACHR